MDAIPFTFSFIGDACIWREQCNIHCEGMDFTLENGRALWAREGKMAPLEFDSREQSGDEAFIALLRGEGPNWSPLEDVWPVMSFTRAAIESAESGRETAIDHLPAPLPKEGN
jgi:hypothetical protein